MPKIWIIAGESSGDTYGAALASALLSQSPHCEILGMGGHKMRSAGVSLAVDSSELGVIGFFEVLKSIFFFAKLLKSLSKQIIDSHPDCVVLIDYPGFNIRLAKRLHQAGIKVFWYISPQVWAWKKGRIKTLASCVDEMFCIFPFEPSVYNGSGLKVSFVGHPLLEQLKSLRESPISRDPDLILLLPGSRTGEINRLLIPILQTAEALLQTHPNYRFAMPLQRDKSLQQVQKILAKHHFSDNLIRHLEITVGNSREIMKKAIAGIAASGTVTVEAAILGLPLVVIYKVNWFTYFLAKLVIQVKWLSILNIVSNKTVYQELIQGQATPRLILSALLDILPNGSRVGEVHQGLNHFISLLQGDTPVSAKIAQKLLEK